MSKMKLLSIAVIGLLVMNLATVSFLLLTKPPHLADGRPPVEQAGPKNIIIEKLKFDSEQIAEYEKLIEQHQAKTKSLNDNIDISRNELYFTLASKNLTGNDSLMDRIGQLQTQMELTHYDHFKAIRAICKLGQIAYFNKLTKELARFFATEKRMGHRQ